MPRRKMTVSPDASDYAEFIRTLELVGLAMLQSTAHVDRDAYLGAEDQKQVVEWSCKAIQVKPQYFDVVAGLKMRVTKPGSLKPFFELTVDYLLHLHSKKISAKFVNRFADSEVRLIVWPYFREYVSSICGRMHIPPIILPFAGRT